MAWLGNKFRHQRENKSTPRKKQTNKHSKSIFGLSILYKGGIVLLGTLLMALRGRSTRTVRMADRLMFCRSSEYSTILEEEKH